MEKILLFSILFWLFSCASFGQSKSGIIGETNFAGMLYKIKNNSGATAGGCPNAAKLDSFFNALSEANQGMGSIAISKNGKLLYNRTIGYEQMNDRKKDTATEKTK